MATKTSATKTDRYGFPVVECSRCFGNGKLNGFTHVQGGACFSCEGKGYVYRAGKSAELAAAFYAAMREAQRPALANVKVGDEIRFGKTEEFRRVEMIENTGKVLGTGRRGDQVWHTYEYTYRLAGEETIRSSSNLMVQRKPDIEALKALLNEMLSQI